MSESYIYEWALTMLPISSLHSTHVYVYFAHRIVLVPHLGSATLRTESDMALLAAENVLRALNGQEMRAPVYQLDAK